MSLKEYRSKRNLKESREPAATRGNSSELLRFCVQKHHARRLHYDFRLEYEGVLLSWAIPKGPSLNPKDKRLAVKVEDHPLEYQYFEGMIPAGNYGAGKVEIWDSGFYSLPNAQTSQEIEKGLTQGLKKGHFTIILHGKKLKGAFTFQKLQSASQDNNWLLIKKEDSTNISPPTNRKKNSQKKHLISDKQSKMPEFIYPMLATLVSAPFSSEEWLFEIKWDGYRALAFINKGEVRLKSRANKLLNAKFPSIIENLEKIDEQVILDGEIVVVDEEGKSHFQLIQNYQKSEKGNLYYYVFDLLFKNGEDLRNLPLTNRREILKNFLNEHSFSLIRFSDDIFKDGESFFKEAAKKQLEGIIGKKITSIYQSRRSQDWVKIKTGLRQEVVIGGFTAPRGSRKKFGSLLVGVYDDQNELNYVGHVGGGFDSKLLEIVYHKLIPLIRKKSPFKKEPEANEAVTWVKPQLVCEVSFAEWTKDNRMRQPIFHGLRTDKIPKSIKKEMAELPPKAGVKKEKSKNSSEKIALTNLDKIYWKEENYTKGDLLEYYKIVSPIILPYLKDRPIMMHRFPNGIGGKDFYQKDFNACPDWIKIYPIQHEETVIHYLGISDLHSLLYVVNLGSIDLHPFLSRYQKLEYPDYCVIDLDPLEIDFEKVVEAALVAHEILEEIKIKHYCKTSGSKGLHLLIPLHGKYDYEQSQKFAEIISFCIHNKLPQTTSLERSPKKRAKKVYLDCLQNRFGQTLVAPYSVRPRPKAPVSTPLLWSEVNKHLDPNAFNITTIPSRLKEKGDIFKGILREGVNIKTSLEKLKKFFQ